MGYKSDVRLITTKAGLKTMKQQSKSNEEISNIINDLDINKQAGNIVYLGWNNIRAVEVDTIEEIINTLEEKEISYRLTIMGEEISDIEERHYTFPKDEKYDIPYPSINRCFDEEDMKIQLKHYEKDTETVELEVD